MEPVSLAASLLPLITTCFDVVEKVTTFQEYVSSSHRLSVAFDSAKFKLKVWGHNVGFVDNRLAHPHHPRLDIPEVVVIIRNILTCLREAFDKSNDMNEKLTAQLVSNQEKPDGYHLPRRTSTGGSRSGKPSRFSRAAIAWTIRNKAIFAEEVEAFRTLVEDLYAIVPPDDTSSLRQNEIHDLKDDLKSIISPTLTSVEALRHEIKRLKKDAVRDSRRADLNDIDEWLNPPKIDQGLEELIEDRLEGTCSWILETQAYADWGNGDFTDKNAKLLWLHGPPGYGKSILSATITCHLTEAGNYPTAHFFSSAYVQAGYSPLDIVRSWISQLCRNDNIIFELVCHDVLIKDRSRHATQAEIWTLFGRIVSEVDQCTLILDGFDEFSRQDDARTKFLEKLKKTVTGTWTRLLISSRPEDDIGSGLTLSSHDRDAGLQVYQCKITADEVGPDVFLYANKMITDRLPNEDAEQQQALVKAMTDKCEGMFLWIKLQKPKLREGKSRKQLLKVVEGMPAGLAKTYDRNWEAIQNHEEEEDRQKAIEILRWVCFALRPLKVGELAEALVHEYGSDGSCKDYLPTSISEAYINGEVKALCGSLIEIRNASDCSNPSCRTVHLIHSSAREFLIIALPTPFPAPVPLPEASPLAVHHLHLTEVCLRYLTCAWTLDQEKQTHNHEIGKQFLQYASFKWFKHQETAAVESEEYKQLSLKLFNIDEPFFARWVKLNFKVLPGLENLGVSTGDNARLYSAACFAMMHIMDYLHNLNRLDFSSTTFGAGTPLIYAARYGSNLIFDRFLDWGADVNGTAQKYGSPLAAAVNGQSLRRVRTLLDRGADMQILGLSKMPILTLACEKGNLDIIKLLLDRGADPLYHPNLTAFNSPLFMAVRNGNADAVDLLISNGANIHVEDNLGRTALHLACLNRSAKVVKALLEAGANASSQSKRGNTPLHLAIRHGHPEYAPILLKYGTDLSIATNSENGMRIPMYEAVVSNQAEIVKMLLQAGSRLHALGMTASTAMLVAVKNDALDVVKCLAENATNLVSPTYMDHTPMQLIEEHDPLNEKIPLWRSSIKQCLSLAGREYWLKNEVHHLSRSLLQTRQEFLFSKLGRSLALLHEMPDARFAFEQGVVSGNSETDCCWKYVRCDNCDMRPLKGTRHVCINCLDRDFCNACHQTLGDSQYKECCKHEFMHVWRARVPPIEEPRDNLKDPEVQTWLENNLVKYKVETPPPPLEAIAVRDLTAGRKDEEPVSQIATLATE